MIPLPKLRLIDVRPFVHDGRQALLLRDPLLLSGQSVVVPRVLAPLLALCDGTRDGGGLAAAAAVQYGLQVGQETVGRLLQALDDALLLDNERYTQERARAQAEYRAAPFRPPSLAGSSYPADPGELRALLGAYMRDAQAESPPPNGDGAGRGLVSPHIDYARGGPVYARVWGRAAEAVREADLAIILGTDHYGGESLNLTRQNYGTPFGVLPNPTEIVDELAEVVGPEEAFAGELRHRGEHSVELAAVWLHYVREGRPVEMLPILCGSFARYMQDGATPDSDGPLGQVVVALRKRMEGRRAVVVAAGDLAHVGPAFGGEPLDGAGKARLQAADDELLAHMAGGDADGFLGAIKRVGDANNVCGVSPIYLTMRLLDPARGEAAGYDLCPADGAGTSVVSVCGVVFR